MIYGLFNLTEAMNGKSSNAYLFREGVSPAESIPKEQIVKCARELCGGSLVSCNGLCRYTH